MRKLLVLFIAFVAVNAGAQTASTDPYTRFLNSFISGTSRESRADEILISSSHFMTTTGCIQTMCLIKVEVDSMKNVQHMELSDSADSLFKKRFAEKQRYLDIKSLENYLQTEFSNSKSTRFIIPFSYFIYTENCEQQIPLDVLKNYNRFQGVGYYGTLLKPIGFEVLIQH